MSGKPFSPVEGGCTCSTVRYVVERKPLIVHCCHCTWCQRETGSAFAVNALVEAEAVTVTKGSPETIDTPSNSGRGQPIVRCPKCHVALWSHYSAFGATVNFMRVGTLDQPQVFPPDIHIFTSTKQPWVQLEGGVPAVDEYYRRSEYWPAESIERFKRLMGR